MWNYKKKQKEFEIGNIKLGGIPGKRPTVLVGSIFYNKQSILENEETGDFNKKKAIDLILSQQDLTEKTGNPHFLDVVAASPTAIRKYLEFISNISDAPLLIGGVSPEIRIAGLKYSMEIGLKNPLIYNSITPDCKREEFEEIKEMNIDSAILLAYTSDPSIEGRLESIKRILPIVENMGIKKILIDTYTLDVPSLGLSLYVLSRIKGEYGYPSGCGPHNAIATWFGLKEKFGKKVINTSLTSVCVAAAAAGADFILYGPIEKAEYVFPAIAMMNAAYGGIYLDHNIKLERDHPIHKIA